MPVVVDEVRCFEAKHDEVGNFSGGEDSPLVKLRIFLKFAFYDFDGFLDSNAGEEGFRVEASHFGAGSGV